MKHILIIEDDTVIAEVQKDYLEANGYSVDVATSGDMGLEKALQEEYDLLILDLMLPIVDGFEICKQVRKAKNIPILLVSAKKEDIDKIRGLGLGADDHISKPFSLGELVARVKAHLARYDRLVSDSKPHTAKEEIRLRGIRIDKLARRVYINGNEVAFTSKEYDLLLFLVTHPNWVFSKTELFEKIWGLDSYGDIATVTVHISKLREKIESDPAKPQYIETVWGVGYRFLL
ncbi:MULTISPECIES: response regulator transcription factor [Brevibacillus]|uniref:response regulator transcription factor n=1 Tax=Brevibacillus TaxID=55080 RepID=UPI001C8DA5D3|nr:MULTISPECIES: response regulator transcription factor [Brevibacillus]MBY0086304.1 response regulator transcription factor [Brevibacillus brevis]MCE0450286.1 response regulator transcription factor [Brevibacillus sp. AF8]MCM3144973.1 response regulator transcription factor [Brevibacillus sp. MER 51]UKL00100.1 response regulator transcription factor [Brevibacillus brevis]